MNRHEISHLRHIFVARRQISGFQFPFPGTDAGISTTGIPSKDVPSSVSSHECLVVGFPTSAVPVIEAMGNGSVRGIGGAVGEDGLDRISTNAATRVDGDLNNPKIEWMKSQDLRFDQVEFGRMCV